MEENEKIPEAKIAGKGKLLTWLENFWYHYKWHTIIIGVAAIILIVCLWQTSTTEKHDTVIIYAGPMCLSTGEIRQLEEALSTVLPSDKDGNGEKNAAMSMYQIYSKDQIKELETETDDLGIAMTVDVSRNANQYDTYNNYVMTGESPVCFLDPWLYDEIPEGYLYPLSEIFGEEAPKGAIGDGYGIRLGDTDLYKDYSIVRLLPADTVICLRAPYGGLGQDVDDEKYQFEMNTFKAFVSYTSSSGDIFETDALVNEKKEKEVA
ncbi:MAG: hypothetical protein IJ011_08400 [Clostridia bacterium]|nr:hypothetical protein [Clostridia bacterium]